MNISRRKFWPMICLFCLSLSLIVTFQACDTFEEDAVEGNLAQDEQNEFYTLPNSAVIMDFGEKVSSFEEVTISIPNAPAHGKLTKLSGTLFSYQPAADFHQGTDLFKITISQHGRFLKRDSIQINIGADTTTFPCKLYAMEDSVTIAEGTSVSIPFLSNDRLCGISKRNLQKQIVQAPLNGTAFIINDILKYTPYPGFHGEDVLVYKISARNNKSFGLVRIQVLGADTCQLKLTDDVFTFNVPTSPNNRTFEFSITDNDILCSADTITDSIAVHGLAYGTLNKLGFGRYAYTTDSSISRNTVTFDYSICLNGICDVATVTLKFNYGVCQIRAFDDIVQADSASTGSVNLFVLNNDVICGSLSSLSIVSAPRHGVAQAHPNKITYKRHSMDVTTDSLRYRICVTPSQCSEASVRILFH